MQRTISTVSRLNRRETANPSWPPFIEGNDMMKMMGGMEEMKDMFKHPAGPKWASGDSPPNDRIYRGHIAGHPSLRNGGFRRSIRSLDGEDLVLRLPLVALIMKVVDRTGAHLPVSEANSI